VRPYLSYDGGAFTKFCTVTQNTPQEELREALSLSQGDGGLDSALLTVRDAAPYHHAVLRAICKKSRS